MKNYLKPCFCCGSVGFWMINSCTRCDEIWKEDVKGHFKQNRIKEYLKYKENNQNPMSFDSFLEKYSKKIING